MVLPVALRTRTAIVRRVPSLHLLDGSLVNLSSTIAAQADPHSLEMLR